MTTDLDFYDLLGVSEEATQEEIRKGFRRQVREYHPDLNDDPRAPAQFTALKKAYDTLADSKERDAYDRMGHEEYVKKRISGLPSPEDWQVPGGGTDDDADGGDARKNSSGSDPDRSTANGTARGSNGRAAGAGGRRSTTNEDERERKRRSKSERERESEGGGRRETREDTEADTRSRSQSRSRSGSSASTGRRTTTTGNAARSTVGERSERSLGPDADPSADAGNGSSSTADTGDRWQSRASTGAGTARDPDAPRFEGGGGNGTAENSGPVEESGPAVGQRVRQAVDAVVTSMFGWPMIVAADALFLASMGLYAAENAAGIERLVDGIGRAGLDLGALQSVLETRPEGLDSLSAFIGSQIASVPTVGFLVLVGIAFLPSVYFFLVRWTRKNRLPWQPSYLYVLGALAPVLGLVISGTVAPGGVYVEVLLYFLVPVVTIFAMLFFGQIKPRMKRVYRRWRYRLES